MAASTELLQLVLRTKKDKKTFDTNVEITGDSDDDDNGESQHKELLQKVKSLGKRKQAKRHKGAVRSEPSQQVSEFNLKSGEDDKLNLQDLVGSLQNSSYHGSLKKTLESMQRMGKTVDTPLAKPAAERIQRAVAYEETSKDITKWDPVVQKNRQADHLSFPLNTTTPAQMSTGILTATFKPQTPLELEIANVLQSNSNILERNNKELSLEEEKALQTMSLEEALERRNELRKMRFLQSHYEQKCRRMKKIKSKKYHRIKRKAEKRAASKETFEKLQQENPELAEKELEKADRLRIGERMSLKHRNTSKWAKNLITKGIKDVEARQALAEQLRISRQLTETKKDLSDSEDEDSKKTEEPRSEDAENIRNFALLGDNSSNPWLLSDGNKKENKISEDQDKGESCEKIRKLESIIGNETTEQENDENDEEGIISDQDETFELMDAKEMNNKGQRGKKVKKKKVVKGKKKKSSDAAEEDNGRQNETKKKGKAKKRNLVVDEDEEENGRKRKVKVKQKIVEEKEVTKKKKKGRKLKTENVEVSETSVNLKEDMQGQEMLLNETDGADVMDTPCNIDQNDSCTAKHKQREDQSLSSKVNVNLDPKKVFQIEDHGRSAGVLNLANEMSDNDDDEGVVNQQRMSIQEAFANDDVIEEFVKEKSDAIEAGKPKHLDTCLPGWGDWGGPGIEPAKKKVRKNEQAQQKAGPARKDAKLTHVIINEERDKKFAKNQVSSIPYPYTSHEQWERSIRSPLGKHWNTMSVHKKLIQPRVNTLPGTIIEPIQPTKDMKQRKDNEQSKMKIHH